MEGRFKGRVVATGRRKRYGIDCRSSFARAFRIESQRYLLTIAVANGWSGFAMDFSAVFFTGSFPKSFTCGKPRCLRPRTLLTIKLLRSIYELRYSPKTWNGNIDGNLQTIGFLSTASDACVYVKSREDNYGMLTLSVDNLLTTGSNDNTMAKVRKPLMGKFAMMDFGDATQILEIDIIHDKEHGVGS